MSHIRSKEKQFFSSRIISYTNVLIFWDKKINLAYWQGRVMKNQLLSLVLSIFTLTSVSAVEFGGLDVRIGGDAYVRGFSNNDETGSSDTKNQGMAQLFRMRLDVTTKDKIRISTRATLSGDKWNGDPANNAPTGTNSDNDVVNGNGGNPVRLDYGFIEVPFKNGWIARAGRQTANFSECFNTCDDRRDRLLLMKAYGNYVPVVLYDKRREGATNSDDDDSDMYAVALFHVHQVHEWALLYAYFDNSVTGYQLGGVHNFSPYYKFKGDKFSGLAVWNWLGAGETGSWYDNSDSHSMALKGEYRINSHFDVGFQTIQSFNGGLIAPGYDSFSFVVNSSPEYNQSNTNLVNIGGLGTLTGGDQDDESLYIARVRYFQKELTAALSVGKARQYSLGVASDLMIYDLQLKYQYTKSTYFNAGYAVIRDDKKMDSALFQVTTNF